MVSSSARIHFSRSSAPRAWKWNVFPSTVIVNVLSSSSSIPMTAPFSLTHPRRTPRIIFSFDCNKGKNVQLCMQSVLSAHSLTHSWSWALLEKLPIVQLLKNSPAFYGTWRFITMCLHTRWLYKCSYLIRQIQTILVVHNTENSGTSWNIMKLFITMKINSISILP
jgi:hypothetical protein